MTLHGCCRIASESRNQLLKSKAAVAASPAPRLCEEQLWARWRPAEECNPPWRRDWLAKSRRYARLPPIAPWLRSYPCAESSGFPVSRFLQIMEMRTEAPELVGSLATLSDFYTDNSPAARRRLRSTIENQGVRINEQFLEAAQSVIKVRLLH